MKLITTVLFFFIFCFSNSLQAQKAEKPVEYRNEFGTDVTALLERLLNFNIGQSAYYSPYRPTYFITYKRLYKKINFRFGIGGSSSSSETKESYFLPDSILKRSNSDFDYRIGVEKSSNISKHWSFYYGIDFRNTLSKSYSNYSGSNAGWGRGNDSKAYFFAVAPMFSIEFKINNRISLQTQADFTAYWEKKTNKPIIIQLTDNPSGEKPSMETEVDKKRGTFFTIPNFIVIAVRI